MQMQMRREERLGRGEDRVWTQQLCGLCGLIFYIQEGFPLERWWLTGLQSLLFPFLPCVCPVPFLHKPRSLSASLLYCDVVQETERSHFIGTWKQQGMNPGAWLLSPSYSVQNPHLPGSSTYQQGSSSLFCQNSSETHRHAQRCVPQVLVNPVKLRMKIEHYMVFRRYSTLRPKRHGNGKGNTEAGTGS